MTDNWPGLYRASELPADQSEFLRRVLAVHRPIPIVENIHEARLECGHEPLLLGGKGPPEVGTLMFCPDCYEKARKN
jgi:hypothetical protein